MGKKFSEEELLRFKQAGFSAEEIVLFQHNPEYAPTLEECDAIELTNTLGDAMKLIPEDKKEFFGLIDRTYGVAMTKATSREELRAMILKLAQKDSKLAIQLATYLQMLDLVAEI